MLAVDTRPLSPSERMHAAIDDWAVEESIARSLRTVWKDRQTYHSMLDDPNRYLSWAEFYGEQRLRRAARLLRTLEDGVSINTDASTAYRNRVRERNWRETYPERFEVVYRHPRTGQLLTEEESKGAAVRRCIDVLRHEPAVRAAREAARQDLAEAQAAFRETQWLVKKLTEARKFVENERRRMLDALKRAEQEAALATKQLAAMAD